MKPLKPIIDAATGESFVPRRSNQKFISLQTKNAFHNGSAKTNRKKYEKYLKPLISNIKLLEKWIGVKTEIIMEREFMKGAGFDFNYRTRTIVDKEGVAYPSLGPFAYLQFNQTQIKIFRYE